MCVHAHSRIGCITCNHHCRYKITTSTGMQSSSRAWTNGCSSAMVDTFGLPTIFFIHSAANLQWPELAHLICPDNADSSISHSKALQENQLLLTGSSFHHRIHKFVDASMSAILMPLKPVFFLTLRLGVRFCGFRSRDHVALRLSPW